MIVRHLGLTKYTQCYDQMRSFTNERQPTTPDEFWITEHHPVYTQGLAGKPEHILITNAIPIIPTDRGGQVTYHGPQQLIFYPLLDVKRRTLSPRKLVSLLEWVTIATLQHFKITAYAKPHAPGVYVIHEACEKKIASLGLRFRRGFCYHGLALNIDMDLTPFEAINPCGHAGLKMANASMLNPAINCALAAEQFMTLFLQQIDPTKAQEVTYNGCANS